MKKDQIKIGGTYMAKVTDKVVPVRIDAEHSGGGWDATNLVTNKKVRIKSAQRLRGPAPKRDDGGHAKAIDAADGQTASSGGERAIAKGAGAKPKKEKKAKRVSGLDTAAEVLKASGKPMRCKDIVDTMLGKGLWKTGGKTPAATIYSAMLREIQVKGKDARFKKVERGLFALAK